MCKIKEVFLFHNFKKPSEPIKYTQTFFSFTGGVPINDLRSFRKTGYLFPEWGLAEPKNVVNQENVSNGVTCTMLWYR